MVKRKGRHISSEHAQWWGLEWGGDSALSMLSGDSWKEPLRGLGLGCRPPDAAYLGCNGLLMFPQVSSIIPLKAPLRNLEPPVFQSRERVHQFVGGAFRTSGFRDPTKGLTGLQSLCQLTPLSELQPLTPCCVNTGSQSRSEWKCIHTSSFIC